METKSPTTKAFARLMVFLPKYLHAILSADGLCEVYPDRIECRDLLSATRYLVRLKERLNLFQDTVLSDSNGERVIYFPSVEYWAYYCAYLVWKRKKLTERT